MDDDDQRREQKRSSSSSASSSSPDVDSGSALPVAASFEAMGLKDELLRGLYHYGFEKPSSIQQRAILPILKGRDVIAQAQSGTGKCFARGTRLRLFDGQAIAVEQVLPGMELMGDDGQPRTVTADSLARGVAPLYRINPTHDGASPFTVNGDHILVLTINVKPHIKLNTKNRGWELKVWRVTTDHRRVTVGSRSYATQTEAQAALDALMAAGWEPPEWEPTVEEFMAAPASRRRWCKLMASDAVTFSNPQLPSLQQVLTQVLWQPPSTAQLEYMAWWLGVWVTDGISDRASICQGGADPPDAHHHHEVFDRLRAYQRLFNEPVVKEFRKKSSAGWDVLHFDYGVRSVADRVLRSYGLLNSKQIPRALICDSVEVRRRLLAGIIDGDGWYSVRDNNYDISAKERHVVNGYKELAATLGLRNSAVAVKTCTNQQTEEVYTGHRLNISGDMWDTVQHCALSYKQCPRPGTAGFVQKTRDSRCYGFTIEPLDAGEYFGFAVDGGVNRRFLLEDYTVTHNVSRTSTAPQPLPPSHRLTVCLYCAAPRPPSSAWASCRPSTPRRPTRRRSSSRPRASWRSSPPRCCSRWATSCTSAATRASAGRASART